MGNGIILGGFIAVILIGYALWKKGTVDYNLQKRTASYGQYY